jgi:thioredoxin-related protein
MGSKNRRFKKTVNIWFTAFALLFSGAVFSQTAKVPPFQMIQTNNKVLNATGLPFDKHIVIYYFSPECEECERVTDELVSRKDELEKASIVFITYFPLETVKEFAVKHALNGYPNIYIGTEGNSMFVANYYRNMDFPFIVLYDKKGNYIKNYNRAENLDDLILSLGMLN